MNLSEVRTTIRDRLIELEYEEFKATSFETENVPETIIDKSFHVTVPSGDGEKMKMDDLIVTNNVEIVVWRKGYRLAVEAVDAALLAACEIISSIMEVGFRTTPAYRNIQFDSYAIDAIANDNENTVKLTMKFTVQVSMAVTADIT